MGFVLDQNLLQEAAIAAYEASEAGTHHARLRVVAEAVTNSIARQLEIVVSMPGSSLSDRLDALLECVPNDPPSPPSPVRKSRKS